MQTSAAERLATYWPFASIAMLAHAPETGRLAAPRGIGSVGEMQTIALRVFHFTSAMSGNCQVLSK